MYCSIGFYYLFYSKKNNGFLPLMAVAVYDPQYQPQVVIRAERLSLAVKFSQQI